MKKILIFGMTDEYAGMESFIMNYYRNIDKNNIHFDFLVTLKKKIAYEDEIIENGSKIYRIGRKRVNYREYKKTINTFFKEHSKEYDAIWVNTCHISNIDYLIYAKKYGIKRRILHSHNNNSSITGSIIKKIYYKFSHNLNKFRQLFYATDYWACSREAAKFLFNRSIYSNNKYKVIPNAIDLSKFTFDSKEREKYRKQLGISKDCFLIGHVGRFQTQKNHKYLIDIFNSIHNKNNNTKLLLIGEGPLENEIKEKVDKLQLSDSVIFMGRRTDVNKLYSCMDVFLFPSLYEGLGIVIIEAQSSKLPCVVSEGIPKEVKVTNCLKYINLEKSPDIWANEVLNSKSRENVEITDDYYKYEIQHASKKLESDFLNWK